MGALITLILGFLLLICMIFFAVFLPAYKTIIKIKSCVTVNGKIVDVQRTNMGYGSDSGPSVGAHYKCEYIYDNVTYKAECWGFDRDAYLNCGDDITIYVNKDNPCDYIPPNKVKSRYKKLVLSIFAMFWLIFALIVILTS